MNDSNPVNSFLSRSRIFAIGSVSTVVLCGLILLCVPKKPDVVADEAKPQALAVETAAAVQAMPSPTPVGPASFRTGTTGERLYGRFCAGCHGADGLAQTQMARMMKSPPTNLAQGPWKGPQTESAVIDIIKNGKGAMPAYGKEITEPAELESLAQHVLSLRSKGKN